MTTRTRFVDGLYQMDAAQTRARLAAMIKTAKGTSTARRSRLRLR